MALSLLRCGPREQRRKKGGAVPALIYLPMVLPGGGNEGAVVDQVVVGHFVCVMRETVTPPVLIPFRWKLPFWKFPSPGVSRPIWNIPKMKIKCHHSSFPRPESPPFGPESWCKPPFSGLSLRVAKTQLLFQEWGVNPWCGTKIQSFNT